MGAVLVWMGLAGLGISAALWLLAEPVVAITGPGLAEDGTAAEAVRYIQMLAPVVLLGSLSSVFYAVCQAETMFPAIATGTVVGPLLTLAIMVGFWDTLGLDGLILGTIAGTALSLSIVAGATIARRVAPSPRLAIRGLGLREVVGHAGPLSLSAMIMQLNLMIDRAVASVVAVGGVSALRYGELLVRIPFTAIRPAWSTALYPELVRASQGPDRSGLATTTERVLRYALAFFVPLAGLTFAVAPLAVATAYDRGSFGSDDLALTAQVVAVSAPLIVTWTVSPTLVSALNARRKGTVMLAASVVNISLNLVLNVTLGYLLGVVGVALATTLVSVVMVAYFGFMLKRVEPTFSPRRLGPTFVKALLAILPSVLVFGIPIWAGVVGKDLVWRVLVLAVVGAVGLSSYFAIARHIGLGEASAIAAFGRNTLRRIGRR